MKHKGIFQLVVSSPPIPKIFPHRPRVIFIGRITLVILITLAVISTGCGKKNSSSSSSSGTSGTGDAGKQTDGSTKDSNNKNNWKYALNPKKTSVKLMFSPPPSWMVRRSCRYEIRFPKNNGKWYLAEKNYEIYNQSPEVYENNKIQGAIRRYKKGYRLITNPANPPPRKPEREIHTTAGMQIFLDRTEDRPIVTRQASEMPVHLEGIVLPDTAGLLLPNRKMEIGDAWNIEKNNRFGDVLSRIRMGATISGTCRLVRVRTRDEQTTALVDVSLDIKFPTPAKNLYYQAQIQGFLRANVTRKVPEFLTLRGPIRIVAQNTSLPDTLPVEPGTFHFLLKEDWYK